MPDSSLSGDSLLDFAAVAAILVLRVEFVAGVLLEGNEVSQHVVFGADFAGRAQEVAVGAHGTTEVAHFALHLEAAGFAGGRVFGGFRVDAQVLVLVGAAGEGRGRLLLHEVLVLLLLLLLLLLLF